MHVAQLVRRTCLAAAVAGGLALTGLAAPAAFAQNPPGNNGTIKIDGEEFDDHPDNQPHVGCIFQVDFYGFDEGDLDADVTFEVHQPTGDEVILTDTVFIGEDDNSGGGSEKGLDASATYTLDLSEFEPHPKQGFHVKLTINAEGSQGADTKHKVFWVDDCGPTPTPTSSTTQPTPNHTPTATATPTKGHEEEENGEEKPEAVPTAVPAGTDSTGGGSGAGIVGLVLTTGGIVAGSAVIARRRFLHGS